MPTSPPQPVRRDQVSALPTGTFAVVLDECRATAQIMVRGLHMLAPASVEVAASYDEALDLIGIASRPTHLLLAAVGDAEAAAHRVHTVLCQHEAPILAHYYGTLPSEDLEPWGCWAGAAGYCGRPFRLATLLAQVARRASRGLTIRRILREKAVPLDLSLEEALALYARAPGERFDLDG